MKIEKLFYINLQKTVTFLPVMMIILILFSCKDQDEIFKEHVVEGGITYLGSISSLKAKIGFNRLEVNFKVIDATTTKVGIYWNDYQDSVMVNIGKEKTIRQIIELPEGEYSLFVKSFDQFRNSSNPVELITRTIGESYMTGISHRAMKSRTTSFNNDLTIEWQNADPINGARFTELIYTDINSKEKRIRVENGDVTTFIDDYKQGTIFKRITYYSPDNQWLDTITPHVVTESTLMIDKSLGSVIEYSTQNSSYPASNFYNGNLADTWFTNNNYPEYIVIDLGMEIPVSSFSIWPSYQMTGAVADPRAPTHIKFEGSLDKIEWINLGEFNYDNSLFFHERIFEIPVTNARYIRFTGIECKDAPIFNSGIGGSGNKLLSLAELDVFFKLEN